MRLVKLPAAAEPAGAPVVGRRVRTQRGRYACTASVNLRIAADDRQQPIAILVGGAIERDARRRHLAHELRPCPLLQASNLETLRHLYGRSRRFYDRFVAP
jgi:hypothetical protein